MIFGPVVHKLEIEKLIEYIWVFAQKQNKNGKIVRYRAQIVAQGFSQKPGIDLWRNIFTNIGCNNISIFDFASCIIRSAFISNGWCYNLFVRLSYFWTRGSYTWGCKTRWVQMNFCAKSK